MVCHFLGDDFGVDANRCCSASEMAWILQLQKGLLELAEGISTSMRTAAAIHELGKDVLK
jgi:hypothetical protein